jgi:hypothetical protein
MHFLLLPFARTSHEAEKKIAESRNPSKRTAYVNAMLPWRTCASSSRRGSIVVTKT